MPTQWYIEAVNSNFGYVEMVIKPRLGRCASLFGCAPNAAALKAEFDDFLGNLNAALGQRGVQQAQWLSPLGQGEVETQIVRGGIVASHSFRTVISEREGMPRVLLANVTSVNTSEFRLSWTLPLDTLRTVTGPMLATELEMRLRGETIEEEDEVAELEAMSDDEQRRALLNINKGDELAEIRYAGLDELIRPIADTCGVFRDTIPAVNLDRCLLGHARHRVTASNQSTAGLATQVAGAAVRAPVRGVGVSSRMPGPGAGSTMRSMGGNPLSISTTATTSMSTLGTRRGPR